jgi:hypothetical protein
VPDDTTQLFVTLTAARQRRKAKTVKFNGRPTSRTDEGWKTVATLQAWINQNPTNLDVVTPIKVRACNALQAVLRSGKPRHGGHRPRIMRRGAERC